MLETVSRKSLPLPYSSFAFALRGALLVLGCLGVGSGELNAAPDVPAAPIAASAPAPAKAIHRPFFEKHCTECHDSDVKKGGLDLTSLPWHLEDRANFDGWVKILDKVRSGEMPPAKKPRPEPAEVQPVLQGLEAALHEVDARRQAVTGRTILRRLNRVEYEKSLHDLLGVDTPLIDMLPEDTALHGFDTVAEGLRLSGQQMEKYLEAADAAINDAFELGPAPVQVSKRYFYKEDTDVRKHLDTPVGAVTDKFNPKSKHRHLLRELPDAIVFFNDGYPSAQLREFYVKSAGQYKIRVSGYAYQTNGQSVYLRIYADNYREKRLLSWCEMPPDKPYEYEFTGYLKRNEHLLLQGTDTGHDAKGQNVYNTDVEKFTGPGLALQWVEVNGPQYSQWPQPGITRLLGNIPVTPLDKKVKKYDRGLPLAFDVTPTDPKAAARDVIERFATRAFRRPLEPGEADLLVKLALDELDGGETFLSAIRVGLRGVLTAPQFLLFDEAPGKLNDYALASRLSYLLWSSLPDESLLEAASQKKLSQPQVLRAQVQRMLKDPKAHAFVTNFTGQWLDLRTIDATTPDKKLYPEYDELLRISMIGETEAFFTELLDHNLPVDNFIQSPFAMLNSRMAREYGIEGVTGSEFRRVALPAGSPRGGILTQASILKVTANGTTTSPVRRGAWVMKRLLGQPPPPPPPNVGSLEPDTRGATTIREQLAKHRSMESCQGCHRHIDPPGFALESFDVIGGFRTRYRTLGKGDNCTVPGFLGNNYYVHLGPAVDASGELSEGHNFMDINGFKQQLLEDRDQVLHALTEKLVTYSTGAGISFADRRDVDAIASRVRKDGAGLETLVQEVVESPLFQCK